MRNLAFFLIAASLSFAAEAWVEGIALDVYDGDTFKLNQNGQIIKIRVFGIDAPESNQPYGQESGKALRGLIDGRQVRIRIQNKDVYGRTVGEPWLGDSLNISLWMIKNGNAWWYKRYSKKRVDFEEAEAEAKARKLGLWADNNPISPWDFRSAEKSRKAKEKNKKSKSKKSKKSKKK
ncbi:MAG: thermonuclease family protein [Fibromonadales bacterium]|nr:thermonuclease family protein [Fibromonadales bacterium]